MKLDSNSKIFFYIDYYRHDLIMNFLLNSFRSKSNKFMVEPIANVISLAETLLGAYLIIGGFSLLLKRGANNVASFNENI